MAKIPMGSFKGPKGDDGDKGDPGPAGPNTVPTDQAIAAAVQTEGSATKAALSGTIGTAVDGAVPPAVTAALANNQTVKDAAAAAVDGELSDARISRSAATTATDNAELIIADGDGRPSWMRAKSNGEPSDEAVRAIARATGVYRGPAAPTFFPTGATYQWFKTDPATGALLDILNGVGA